MPLYVPDQIDGQATSMTVYTQGASNVASAIALGSLQNMRFTANAPKQIRGDVNNTKRMQVTDTMTVDWQCGSFALYKQTFADVLGLKSDPAIDFGNYNFGHFWFDLSEDIVRLDPSGNILQAGGWMIHYAFLTRWTIDRPDPYQIVMSNVEGLAFSAFQKPWT